MIVAFNPNQARQAGGKFGFGKSAPAKAAPAKASQIPAQSIPPQIMAQALTLIRQQQAAARAQAAVTRAESPADKLYLAQLKVAQGILFKEQQAQRTATKNVAAAAKKKAGIAAAAKARNPAAARLGEAAGKRTPARGNTGAATKASSGSSSYVPSSAVQARLQQYLARR